MMCHVHDYDMVFDKGNLSLDYRLVCQCGDETSDVGVALRREMSSRVRRAADCVAAALLALLAVLLPTGGPL